MARLPVNVERKIVTFDAEGQSIGRVATGIARVLIGKHKPTYEANRDHGDNVEVRNAAKVKLTGHKLEQKEYYRYSGYPGGLKTKTLKTVMAKDPAERPQSMEEVAGQIRTLLATRQLRTMLTESRPDSARETPPPQAVIIETASSAIPIPRNPFVVFMYDSFRYSLTHDDVGAEGFEPSTSTV